MAKGKMIQPNPDKKANASVLKIGSQHKIPEVKLTGMRLRADTVAELCILGRLANGADLNFLVTEMVGYLKSTDPAFSSALDRDEVKKLTEEISKLERVSAAISKDGIARTAEEMETPSAEALTALVEGRT